MALSVSALVIHVRLLPDSRPVCIGVRHVRVGGVFGVQGSEDLVTVLLYQYQPKVSDEP